MSDNEQTSVRGRRNPNQWDRSKKGGACQTWEVTFKITITTVAMNTKQNNRQHNHPNHRHNLGAVSNNQNGNLRWFSPLGVDPPLPPLMVIISRHFFTPLFFFCNWLLHRWNGFYTWSQSKISLLGPLIIGSKLTFSCCCDRRLPYDSHVHSHFN